ncbi:Uncharacterised protein [Mycobacteroides abscessus subsp. abscessus]|nr:Uncharacterised protein [Mycobacteroides abscessus subsp. abscessus]
MRRDGQVVGHGGLGVIQPVSGVLGQDVLPLLLRQGRQDRAIQRQYHAQIQMRAQGTCDLSAHG